MYFEKPLCEWDLGIGIPLKILEVVACIDHGQGNTAGVGHKAKQPDTEKKRKGLYKDVVGAVQREELKGTVRWPCLENSSSSGSLMGMSCHLVATPLWSLSCGPSGKEWGWDVPHSGSAQSLTGKGRKK